VVYLAVYEMGASNKAEPEGPQLNYLSEDVTPRNKEYTVKQLHVDICKVIHE
jgi:hypothetical protein